MNDVGELSKATFYLACILVLIISISKCAGG